MCPTFFSSGLGPAGVWSSDAGDSPPHDAAASFTSFQHNYENSGPSFIGEALERLDPPRTSIRAAVGGTHQVLHRRLGLDDLPPTMSHAGLHATRCQLGRCQRPLEERRPLWHKGLRPVPASAGDRLR